MKKFKSIQRQLLFLITGLITLATVLSGVFILKHTYNSRYDSLVQKLGLLAEVTGQNTSAAIDFSNEQDAEVVLSSLRFMGSIESGAIYVENTLFAKYQKSTEINDLVDKPIFEGNILKTDDHLFIRKVIMSGDEPVAEIILVDDLSSLYGPFKQDLKIILGIIICVLLITLIIAYKAQGRLIHPILELSNLMKAVADKHDFTRRASKYEENEIGMLTDSFNDMLDQIQIRDRDLKRETAIAETKAREAIAANKRVEAEVEQRLRAESANQMKTEFLANMGHEIRTPMNAILGFCELLEKQVDGSKAADYLAAINKSGRSLLHLINDILDLSKVEAGKMTLKYSHVNLRKLVEEFRTIFTQKVEQQNIDFKVHVEDQVPLGLLIDETRLRQVLFNLLGNAIKFTERGEVAISIGGKLDKDKKFNLVISISDTGIGIEDNRKEHVFEAFEQASIHTSSNYGGTGLGLAICSKLMALMKGEISVESTLGEGSIFMMQIKDLSISLDTSIIDQSKEHHHDYIFERAKILVVDDTEMNRYLLKEYLSEYPFEIIEACNGQEALDCLEEVQPDIIMMDMKMPIMGGYEATTIIKMNPQWAKIPIIAVTASAMKESEAQIVNLCDGFVRKPFCLKDLLRVFVEYLPHHVENDQGNI